MTEPVYEQGDWFHDEALGRTYQWMHNIDTNVTGWYEIYAAPSDLRRLSQRKVDPPLCWKVETVYYSTPSKAAKLYGVAGIENLIANPKHI